MKITNEGWAIIERDTHLCKWVEEHKRLDFDQNALPQMLPYIKPDSIVLDIGANIGCYAYAFSKIAKEVICFEPNKEAFDCLMYNIGKIPGVRCYDYAISDIEDHYEVIVPNDNIGMAYIELTNNPYNEGTTTIDNFIENSNIEDLSFIKIDVEGFELRVLNGAEKTINKFNPVMVIEINDHTLKRTNTTRQEIFKWLTDHGYTYRNIYANQGLQDEQLDIICFPS